MILPNSCCSECAGYLTVAFRTHERRIADSRCWAVR
jgi:hypothetical protein